MIVTAAVTAIAGARIASGAGAALMNTSNAGMNNRRKEGEHPWQN